MKKNKNKKKWWKNKDLLFYCLLMLWPVAQFCVMYIGVNTSAIALAFQRVNVAKDTVEWTFSNIRNAFQMMTSNPEMVSLMSVSIISYLIGLVVGVPLALFFSYYIYKKLPISGAFRVILFLPSILSTLVLAIIYQFFVERAMPTVMMQFFDIEMQGLMENPSTRYGSIMFFCILCGFGTNVLMYSNRMNEISPELSEAAQLDGASTFQEFWHVTLPMVYPTLSTFLIAGVAGIFTNQLNLFSLYGVNAPVEVRTYGYYFFTQARQAATLSEFSYLSAMGLLMTLVAVPLTLLIKWALEKFGPSED